MANKPPEPAPIGDRSSAAAGNVAHPPWLIFGPLTLKKPMDFDNDKIMYSTFGWFGLEVVTMLTNNKRRALHDFIAGSVVIRKPGNALERTVPVSSALDR